MQISIEPFLSFVKLGIGHQAEALPQKVDWNTIQAQANLQGLTAIVLDGIEELRKRSSSIVLPDKKVMTQWIGEVLQGYEYRYELYRRAIAEMAGFYNSHGYKMMVLKGYACSLDWLKPEHRPTGDIDVWLFGQQKEADTVLAKEKRLEIDSSHHHHTVFFWRDFMVENHYDFVNVYAHKSSREIEVVFKELGKDDSHFVDLYGEKVFLPSPNLHALFLIRHMVSHFAAANITLRQVLDWAFFVEKHTMEIDWAWLMQLLEQYHMKDFYNCLNAICVEDLGFSVSIFPSVQFDPIIKDLILNDILSPRYTAEEPKGLVRRWVYKYKRWQGNAWKQKMCYGESRWSMLLSGIVNHLFRPWII